MYNLTVILKLCGILAGTALINIILGCLINGMADNWDWRKFFYGIIKALVLTVCIAGFCVILTYIPDVFTQAGLDIPEELITVLQLFTVLGTTIKKYALDVYEKLQEILNT